MSIEALVRAAATASPSQWRWPPACWPLRCWPYPAPHRPTRPAPSSTSLVSSRTQADAWSWFDGHFHTNTPQQDVGFRLKGDDPWFDDDLGISATGRTWYGDYNLATTVYCSALNEDWGRDELYARVSTSSQSTTTQNVNGYF